MPNLFSYINYRSFLKDHYAEKKADNPSFSFRLFARQAGFSSPNFIKLVMDGKRNLSTDGAHKVSLALKFKKKESEFFHTLVRFNQAEDPAVKNQEYLKLSCFREFKEIRTITDSFYKYFSDWFPVAIREIVLLNQFRDNPEWIANKLLNKVTIKQVEETLKMLKDNGLLKQDKRKRLVQTDHNLATDEEVSSLSSGNFHRAMIQKAADSITETPHECRDISSLTVALDQKSFLEAKKRIQEFRRELNVLLSDCKSPDAIYQLNFQLFNLSEVTWPLKK